MSSRTDKMKMKVKNDETYYEALGLPPTASQLDIKKAYRRLALIYHPDRNVSNDTNETDEDTKEMFQKIGEAYHCLSDPARKRQYDRELQWSSTSSGRNSNNRDTTRERKATRSKASSWHPYPSRPSSSSVLLSELMRRQQQQQQLDSSNFFEFAFEDAFEQFDSLFHQDPFFQEYGFREMDEEFARRFYSNNNNNNNDSDEAAPMTAYENTETQRTRNESHQETNASHDQGLGWMPSWLEKVIHGGQPNNISDSKSPSTSDPPQSTTTITKNTEGWIPWILRQVCGLDCEFQMTTITSNGRGGVTTTNYYSSPSPYSQISKTDPKTSWHVPDYSNRRRQQRHDRIVPSSSSTTRPTKSTYTKMSTSSFVDRKGRRVTIQSKEVDGNRIEDQRINNVLVQRKINGVVVEIR